MIDNMTKSMEWKLCSSKANIRYHGNHVYFIGITLSSEGTSIVSLNPLLSDISMHILLIVLYTFLLVLIRRTR